MKSVFKNRIMKKKEITTIEDLAALIQREFISVHSRFSEMDKRFDKMEKEMKLIKSDLEDLKLRVDQSV